MLKHSIRGMLAFGILALAAHSQTGDTSSQLEDTVVPVEVMVLGTYHFGNPGLDLNNMNSEDVLLPVHQRELQIISQAISAFKPTVVAIEREVPPPYDDPNWEEFTDAALSEKRNETVQLAYRIARDAGAKRVIGIDETGDDSEPDYFPYGAVQDYAEKSGRETELSALSNASEFVAQAEAEQTKSVAHALLFYNTSSDLEPFYWNIIKMGSGENQPGAELAAYWFMRNAKIFNKMQQSTQPGDRVLIVYGAGHSAWLREIADKAEGYELVSIVPYLERAVAEIEALPEE